MIVAYRSPSDTFFENANAFGYKRGLTYQEYIGSGNDVTAINMPGDSYASELQAGLQTGHVSMDVVELLMAHVRSAENAVAIAKALRKTAAEDPSIEKELLGNEEEQALLDGPNGTNYHNFIAKHPEFPDVFLHRQKYYNAGIIDPSDDTFRIYREGNVIFEKDFGSEVFETASTGEKATDGKMLRARIEIQDTSSGLRFVKSHSLGSSGIGIPIAGKCDLISRSDEGHGHSPASARK